MAVPGRHRQPWGTITRQHVIEAGMRAVASSDPDRLTIRSLAQDLGVAPMTIYRHVRDKDDLLEEVVDRLLAEAWRPESDGRDWRAWIVEAADRLRQLIVSQPAARQVYLRHAVLSPAARERMEASLAVLRSSGASEEEAARAYVALQTYTIGFAALEASREAWSPEEGGEDEQAGPAGQLAAMTTPEQFHQGLLYLLDGIAQHTGVQTSG